VPTIMKKFKNIVENGLFICGVFLIVSCSKQIKTTNFQTEEIEIKEVVVMRSQLNPAGAIYTPLKKIALLT